MKKIRAIYLYNDYYCEEVEKIKERGELRSYKVSSKREAIPVITGWYFSNQPLDIVIINSSVTVLPY
ncbi:MAG: hypothetical protein LN588_04070 [Rickettsia endosymbiont of Bryobia graminum]|nr:hypothetical protein [Rickettsia endosymbiont of Bryobia graminum]